MECSKVLLLFLSKAYVTSVNCRLEFRYAIQRGKAFVILFTESDIPMESWMLEAIQGFPQYQVPSYDVLPETINGVPMVNRIKHIFRPSFFFHSSIMSLDRCHYSIDSYSC